MVWSCKSCKSIIIINNDHYYNTQQQAFKRRILVNVVSLIHTENAVETLKSYNCRISTIFTHRISNININQLLKFAQSQQRSIINYLKKRKKLTSLVCSQKASPVNKSAPGLDPCDHVVIISASVCLTALCELEYEELTASQRHSSIGALESVTSWSP